MSGNTFATSNKGATRLEAILISNKGITTSSMLTTSNKKLAGAPGRTTRSKDATRGSWHRY